MSFSAGFRLTGDLFNLSSGQSATSRAIKKNLVEAAEFFRTELILNTPVGVNVFLADGWETDWVESSLSAIVFNNVPYGLVIEFGRRAAAVPIKPLTDWFIKKVGLEPKEARSAAFATSKKKSRQPTPGTHFTQNTFEDNLKVVEENFIRPIGTDLVREFRS